MEKGLNPGAGFVAEPEVQTKLVLEPVFTGSSRGCVFPGNTRVYHGRSVWSFKGPWCWVYSNPQTNKQTNKHQGKSLGPLPDYLKICSLFQTTLKFCSCLPLADMLRGIRQDGVALIKPSHARIPKTPIGATAPPASRILDSCFYTFPMPV